MIKETHKELYKQAIYIAKHYYKFYHKDYKKLMFDLEDLIQEANLVIINILNKERFKNKSIKELEKIVRKAIGFRFNVLKRDNRNILKLKIVDIENEEDEEKIKNQIENKTTLDEENIENIKPLFYICDFKKLLTEQEYNIIYQRFIENKTLKQIKRKFQLDMTLSGVDFIIKQILTKLKKKLQKEL